MIAKLYAKYLLADRLCKIAEEANVIVEKIDLGNGDARWNYTYDVHLQLRHPDGRTENQNEEAAVRLMDAMPSLALSRSSGLIYLTGVTNLGLTYRLYTGQGACERVQVGTRIIPAEPERVIPAQPEREEPIFQVLCADPLRELVAS